MLLVYTDSFVQIVLKAFRETIDPWSMCVIWHGSESASVSHFHLVHLGDSFVHIPAIFSIS
jgi:hypothetical protein